MSVLNWTKLAVLIALGFLLLYGLIRAKQFRKELLLLLITGSLILGALEWAFRRLAPQYLESYNLFEYDHLLGWRFIPEQSVEVDYIGTTPHLVETNAYGFRENSPLEGSGSEKKIMVIGDSFVSNIAVRKDSVFTERLEKSMANTLVYNFGVNGFSMLQDLLLLRYWGPKFKPDIVLSFVYMRNDFGENVEANLTLPRPIVTGYPQAGEILEIEYPDLQKFQQQGDIPFFLKILPESHVYTFFKTRLKIFLFKYFSVGVREDFESPEFQICAKNPSEEMLRQMEIAKMLMGEIHSLGDSLGSKVIFVLAPSLVQAEEELWKAQEYGDSHDPAYPNRILAEHAGEQGMQVLDLLPALRQQCSSSEPCYHRIEQHWNDYGNRVVAQELQKFLKNFQE